MKPVQWWRDALALLIPLTAMVWVVSLAQRLGIFIFPEQILAALLGLAMAVVFLSAAEKPPQQASQPAIALALLSLLVCGYLAVRIPVLSEEAFFRPGETLWVATVVIALLVEATRRSVGYGLLVVLALFSVYAIWGDLIPGKLQARASAPADLLRFLGTDTTAMLGLPLSVTGFIVVMFVLFGRVLINSGGGDFFTGLSRAIAGRGPGSSAKVSIIASSLFGSVSGSAVANVMSTGVVTIPLMKRAGMVPHRAAAIESVASTGGQLMPPIMGAAAFLMAEFLQLPYTEIVLAALLPAVLYYLALFLQVDFLARDQSLGSSEPEQSRSLRAVLLSGWLLPLPFAVLIVGLFQFNLSPEIAVLFALLSLIVLSWLQRDSRYVMTPQRIVVSLADTGRSVAPLILVTAIAGMIIGVLSNTGLSFSLGFVLLGFGQGKLLALLVITALVCIVLGMGLPTTGVYLLLATLAAPPLIELGLQPIQAHLFVLYFGMLSMITPPVALAAFAAASLAQAPQMRTGFSAMRYGWCAYLVPFLFVYHPALLMKTGWLEVLATMLAMVVALLLLSATFAGRALTPLTTGHRLIAFAMASALLLPVSLIPAGIRWPLLALAIGALLQHAWQARKPAR